MKYSFFKKENSPGLALGSGAARGLAHIGVLLWLDENNIKVSTIAGTSLGAMVAAFYASGYSPLEMKDIALSIKKQHLIKYLKPAFHGSSIFGSSGIKYFLKEFLGDILIEELQIPFACSASDLDSGEEIVFREGSLAKAVECSISIPMIFPPVEFMGRNLIDGGIVNPVPLDLAAEMGADRVIGINVSKPVFAKRTLAEREQQEGPGADYGSDGAPLKRFKNIIDLMDKISFGKKNGTGNKNRMFYNIMADTITVFSSRVLSLKRINAGPHVLVEPAVASFKSFDFDRAEELIEKGYCEMEAHCDDIVRFLR